MRWRQNFGDVWTSACRMGKAIKLVRWAHHWCTFLCFIQRTTGRSVAGSHYNTGTCLRFSRFWQKMSARCVSWPYLPPTVIFFQRMRFYQPLILSPKLSGASRVWRAEEWGPACTEGTTKTAHDQRPWPDANGGIPPPPPPPTSVGRTHTMHVHLALRGGGRSASATAAGQVIWRHPVSTLPTWPATRWLTPHLINPPRLLGEGSAKDSGQLGNTRSAVSGIESAGPGWGGGRVTSDPY